MSYLTGSSKIYVAGHKGLVGSAITRELHRQGYDNIIGYGSQEIDLVAQSQVNRLFKEECPDVVFLCAAKVGGIHANATFPGEFIYNNLMIQSNIIHAAAAMGVKRLIFLGSSCIYPRDCPQPIREEYLLSGPLEFTNRPYAVAKIAGIEMCWSYNRQYGMRFLALMPTNLYGPGDNYHEANSHVIPALIRKMHLAKVSGEKTVTLWGTGSARREFLYAPDLAEAAVFLMTLRDDKFLPLVASDRTEAPLINVGCGKDLTIAELAQTIAKVVEYDGDFVWDKTKPDGTPRKVLDVSKLSSLGWHAKTSLEDGLRATYQLVANELAV